MKPILFSTPMVQAILAGTKTQTRRIMKPQPEFYGMAVGECYYNYDGVTFVNKPGVKPLCVNRDVINYKAKYQPGDVLWVRETYWINHLAFAAEVPVVKLQLNDVVKYRADGFMLPIGEKWRPSIFMRQAASRLFLRVTDVRAERLQDISRDDCRAEGMYLHPSAYFPHKENKSELHSAYAALWDSINGPGSWDKNPWAWVYTFERIEKPE